jgi:hypothetical protein
MKACVAYFILGTFWIRESCGLFLLSATLNGDKGAQVFDELCPRAIVLQGEDEPFDFIGRGRTRLRPTRP